MSESAEDLVEKIAIACDEGDEAAEAGNHAEAAQHFQRAWELLPEPRHENESALWILKSLGDALFRQGNYQKCREKLTEAVEKCEGGKSNPYIRLRLGQCLYELDEKREAITWLSGALMTEGVEVLQSEDPKYLEFLKQHLQPPPGGWPA